MSARAQISLTVIFSNGFSADSSSSARRNAARLFWMRLSTKPSRLPARPLPLARTPKDRPCGMTGRVFPGHNPLGRSILSYNCILSYKCYSQESSPRAPRGSRKTRLATPSPAPRRSRGASWPSRSPSCPRTLPSCTGSRPASCCGRRCSPAPARWRPAPPPTRPG